MDKTTGGIVAVKLIPICEEDEEEELRKIVKEIDLLKQCDSPYVTTYYGSYFKSKRLWVSEGGLRLRSLSFSIFFFFFFLTPARVSQATETRALSRVCCGVESTDRDGVLFGREPQEHHDTTAVRAE